MLVSVPFEGGGSAVFSLNNVVKVGDRQLPAEIEVNFPGAPGNPSLTMKLVVRQGVPICSELTLRADDNAEVRTRHLKLIRVEDWLEYIVAVCATMLGETKIRMPDEPDRETLGTVRKARASTRRTVTPEMLAKVADIYREHFDDRPTEAVQRAFGLTQRTAARYVQRCRAEGLLPETTKGKKKA